MGDHQFDGLEVDSSLDRLTDKPSGPLAGAIPPDYLVGKVKASRNEGPASLLWKGEFCGNGKPTYGVFDLSVEGEDLFEIRKTGLDEEGYPKEPSFVEARPTGTVDAAWFPIYDTRKHPASTWGWRGELSRQMGIVNKKKLDVLLDQPAVLESLAVPEMQLYTHPGYRGIAFRVSLGFEYPSDCESPNDVTWFALAVESPDGKVLEIIFNGETQ